MIQAAEQAIAYAEQHNIEEVKSSPPLQHLLILRALASPRLCVKKFDFHNLKDI